MDSVAYSLERVRYERLRSQLEVERASFWQHWQDLAANIQPRRARFWTTDVNKGDRRTKEIIDSTPVFASRTLASGMMSGITSPARPWFRLTTPDAELAELPDVKQWLEHVSRRMNTVFLRSNLYQALPTLYTDLGVFGTAAMAVLEDDETTIRCYPFPIGSYYLANDHKLRVRVFMRDFRLTVRQVVEQFGQIGPDGQIDWSNISSRTKSLWETNGYEQWIDVTHVISPNSAYDGVKRDSRSKRFRACYFERGIDEGKFLAEEGFDEFPVLAPRWEVTGEDVYGTNCPGMSALGDIKQLQKSEKLGAQGLEKLVKPPMVGPPALRGVRASILPGDITYLQEGQNQQFRPIHEVQPFFQELEQKQQQVRQRIDRAFYADLFLMLTYSDDTKGQQPVTATEIQERHEEKLLALGPVLEQLNQDLLDPLIDRTFAIMLRRGQIPDPPQAIQGSDLRVEYVSIMAQAQKMVGLSSLERLASFVGNLATASQDPSVFDKVDRDQMIDSYAEMTGVDAEVVVPQEKVEQVRQQRAQAQQQQVQAEQAQQMAQAAQHLSSADTSGKNALTDLLGTSQGQPGV